MDLYTRLKAPLTLKYADRLAEEVAHDFILIADLFEYIFSDDPVVAWRAAWTCEKVQQRMPGVFTNEHWFRLTDRVLNTSHSGIVRGCLSIMLSLQIPQPLDVNFINHLFSVFTMPKVPVAVQALSMKLLYKICQLEREFIPEFVATLDNCDLTMYSPGFISTRKNILKALNKS